MAQVSFLRSPPIGVFQQSASQPAWSGYQALTFDTTIYDTYGGHSNTVNNSRYTAQVAGYYSVGGIVGFAANATGVRDAYIAKNGTQLGYTTVTTNAVGSSTGTFFPLSPTLVSLNVGDYVEIFALSGNVAASQAPVMTVEWKHL